MRALKGKRALVTGGASGIGLAIAKALAYQHVDVCVLDINQVNLARAVQECRAIGCDAVGRYCDVAQGEELSRCTTELLEDVGSIDILVNNAAVCFYGRTGEMSGEQRQRLLNTNVNAPVQLTCELLPHLLSRPESHILNVTSIYGHIATNRCSLYHLSKFGLVGFSEALRAEYGKQGLGVTALCPGFVQTDLFDSMPNHRTNRAVRRPPNWLCTTAERVAQAGVHGIRRNRRMVFVSPLAHVLYNTRRVAPWLADLLYHVSRKRRPQAVEQTAVGSHEQQHEWRDIIPFPVPAAEDVPAKQSRRAA